MPHRQFTSTNCPGNYDLDRLERIAVTKEVSKDDDWGNVRNKVAPAPAPAPVPTRPTWVAMANPRYMRAAVDLYVYDLVNKRPVGSVIKAGTDIDFKTQTQWDGKTYLRSRSSTDGNRDWGISLDALTEIPAPAPEVEKKPEVIPPQAHEKPSEGSLDKETTTLLQDVKKLLQELTQLLKNIFKIGDK